MVRCFDPSPSTLASKAGTSAISSLKPHCSWRERMALELCLLLTTTAEKFFPRFGFEQIAREDVPPSVQASVEFTSACPTSAIVMRKRLTSA